MSRVVMIVSNDMRSDPRVEREAVALASDGWDVTVLAWGRSGDLPACEARHGYRLERIGPRAAYGAGLRSLSAFRAFWHDAQVRARELAPDVVHCHDLDTAPAGLRVAAAGARLVLDFHELYRESRMVPQGPIVGPLARAAIDALERHAIRRAALLILVGESSVPIWGGRGVPHVIVENAPDADVLRPAEGPRPERPFTVGYIGSKRYLEPLKALVDIVSEHGDLAALLAGGGVVADDLARYAKGSLRVEVTGPFRAVEAPALYARCDAVYAVYGTSLRNARLALPVKGMEGMAAGLPVIADAGTYFGDLVERGAAGLAVDASDRASIEAALVRLKDDPDEAAAMGRAGRAIVERGLNWDAASKRLVEAYRSLHPA